MRQITEADIEAMEALMGHKLDEWQRDVVEGLNRAIERGEEETMVLLPPRRYGRTMFLGALDEVQQWTS